MTASGSRAVDQRRGQTRPPIVIGFAEWRLPNGGTTPVFLDRLGSAGRRAAPLGRGGRQPEALAMPNTVAIDQSYFERLGVKGLGDTAEIRDQKVEVAAVTKGIRSFTTTPYVFTSLDRARAYTGTPANKATYSPGRIWRRRRTSTTYGRG